MASGRKLAEDVRKAVAKDYIGGVLTLPQIAQKHGVAIRTIYDCVDRCIPRYCTKKATNLTSVRLTRNEIELAILLICEMESEIFEEDKPILRTLEEKLLSAADRDEKIKR